ncbi:MULTISPECIES: Mu transposase C-terminal domain-containing protein [Bacillus]|uniref:Mu transposase C-terminal domain-containing protein n=2 Tax=Bacillus TaxID=1386 RepID=UPI000BF61C58|nr:MULTISPECIES: Mu transposase C-terminal domain-containing protein [Bacillus]MBG9854678.1 hypothetical protein [Bacillus wiedmannii]MRS24153.1 DDE-type integrase/transposase/recombinase [Bacillus sp. RIT694]PFW09252.1 hypothetical protein COL22_14555 [Bacillus thuringiensis]
MGAYQFKCGLRFMIRDNEYIVRKEMEKDLEIENIDYKRIEIWSKEELLDLWAKEQLIFRINEESEYINQIPEFEALPNHVQIEAKRRYKILEPVIKGEILPEEISEYLIKIEPKISKSTFYEWKKRWNITNDIRSLVPARSGPKGPSTNEKVLNLLDEVLKDYLYRGEKRTLEQLYSEFLLRIDEYNEFRDLGEEIKSISKSTFYRRVKQVVDKHKLNTLKYGKVQADLIQKGSTKEVVVTRPLQRVEIDWTPLDIMLLDLETLKPRRPWLVYAIDKFTGYPLGFFVTFGNINTQAVKQCLLHTIMPKTYVKRLYPMVENKWEGFGIPELIVLDNAKVNESLDLDDACLQVGIREIQYCAVGAGNQKGTIERAFRTLNTKFVHSLKGTTFSNPLERGQYDSEGKACITMQGFIYMLHIALVDLIANSYDSRRGATPRELWERGMKENPQLSLPMPRSKEELKFILMGGLEKRTITNKGIVIKNEYYTSADLMNYKNYLEINGKEEGGKVRVRYDLDDMRSIYVYNSYERKYIKAYNTGLERKGINAEYPVHYSTLELNSKARIEKKNKVDQRSIGRANRKIEEIQREEQKKARRLKKPILNEGEKNNEQPQIALDVSSMGISHVQLETPKALETLILPQGNVNKEHKKSTNRMSYEIDLKDLPEWDVTFRGGDNE